MTLTARGRLAAAAALVTLVLVVAGGGGLAVGELVGGAMGADPVRTRQVQVLPGQTLWEIARQAAPEADVRTVVDQIVELNGLSGAADLQVGDRLHIPVTVRD